MNTLFDFITHVKGVEYIVGILFIAGYILYWEVLKPKPFKKLAETAREDVEIARQKGYGELLKSIGKIAAAPFIGLVYIIALPFGFIFALGAAGIEGVLTLVGKEAVFGWRPTEAYFGGKRRGKKAASAPDKKEEK